MVVRSSILLKSIRMEKRMSLLDAEACTVLQLFGDDVLKRSPVTILHGIFCLTHALRRAVGKALRVDIWLASDTGGATGLRLSIF